MPSNPNNPYDGKTIVGLVEEIVINGHFLLARIDTGAATSCIDLGLASELQLGPLVAKRTVVSAHGSRIRPVIKTSISIKGRNIRASFTIMHRGNMEYPMLIGRNILKRNFIIDPSLPVPAKTSRTNL